MMRVLSDLGEHGILKKIRSFLSYSNEEHIFLGIGDDCAVFRPKIEGDAIVITTDPCPTPVVNLIGDNDYYNYGWLTVVINVSDLGAMGADPIGILSSTIMPETMFVSEYERFLKGLFDASKTFDCPVIGGNIKDGNEFSASGCAVGSINPKLVIQRSGGQAGDYVFVAGEMGGFWASVLSILKKLDTKNEEKELVNQFLKRPMPKLYEGISLAKNGIVNSCMDSSDGITSCLYCLAKESNLDITIDLSLLKPSSFVENIARQLQIDYRKLMFSWGGWELVGTMSPNMVQHAEQVMNKFKTPLTIIGEAHTGNGNVWCLDGQKRGKLSDIGSYRFSNTSYFTKGIESYLNYLLNTSLYE